MRRLGDFLNKPLISVVIPAYNCVNTISRAIDSALAQDVSVEIIVVDDCSPDNLSEAIRAYSENHQVIYLKNSQNLGAAESRNQGIRIARGEYIAFLDADDIWKPGKLCKQLKLMKSTGFVLCATGRELMRPDGTLTGRVIPVKQEITYRDLLKHNSINCSSVLLKAEVAREFPMHHADSHEDYILWLEILRKYEKACAVNEPLLIYRLSNKGKSGNKFHSARMTFKVYQYMDFGIFKSCACFTSYAVHGVLKYLLSKWRKYEI